MREPTSEECESNAVVIVDGMVGHAIWYPQMGGYVGHAIAVPEVGEDPCWDVYVWHDGEFPFSGEYTDLAISVRGPVLLHHCTPEGFIEFGERLRDWAASPPMMREQIGRALSPHDHRLERE